VQREHTIVLIMLRAIIQLVPSNATVILVLIIQIAQICVKVSLISLKSVGIHAVREAPVPHKL
jgi:hypothetical protein